MALLTESPINEGKIGAAATAIGLMIGMPAAVTFAVLCAPELLAAARGAGADTLGTRGRERDFALRARRCRDDQHGAARIANGPFGDRAQQEPFESLTVVSPDDDQISAEVGRHLDDAVRRGIDMHMRDHPEEQWRLRIGSAEALELLIDMLSQPLERAF